jgi:hypothetical protein
MYCDGGENNMSDTKNNKRNLYTPTIGEMEAIYPEGLSEDPFIGINYWISSDDLIFAIWSIKYIDDRDTLEKTKSFIKSIKDLSQAEKLADNLHLDKDVMEYLHKEIKLTSLISYYESQLKIRQKYVVNLGQILAEVRAKDKPLYGTKFMGKVPPISVVFIHTAGNDFELRIILRTDIWFPWVVGFMEKQPAQDTSKMYDNRRLAFWHTTHFNNFITRLQETAMKLDSLWQSNVDMAHPLYQHMIIDNGILLKDERGLSDNKTE